MKKMLLFAMACLSTITASSVTPVISDMEAGRFDNSLRISYNIAVPEKMKSTARIIATPVLKSESGIDSVAFQPIVFAGRRAYYTLLRRNADYDGIYRDGAADTAKIERVVGYEPWMDRSRIVLECREEGCCGTPDSVFNTPLAMLDFSPRMFRPVYNYIAPSYDSSSTRVKSRLLQGTAYIDFPVNKTEIYPEYRNNPRELMTINSTIDSIHSDSDIDIKSITIKGFASPEGSYANNERLAKGRTEALVKYVRQLHKFPAEILHTAWEAEDWVGLKAWVEKSNIDNKAAILKIIDDSSLSPDARDGSIRDKFPEQYAFLLATAYPALRHSDYAIEYVITNYTDPAKILQVAAEAPQKLSLEEFYLAAETIPADSPESRRLWFTAAAMYPEAQPAIINAANGYMEAGALDQAGALLEKAGDSPEAVYARGNLAALRGDEAKARELFEEARRLGVGDAGEALERLEDMAKPRVSLIENKNKD